MLNTDVITMTLLYMLLVSIKEQKINFVFA